MLSMLRSIRVSNRVLVSVVLTLCIALSMVMVGTSVPSVSAAPSSVSASGSFQMASIRLNNISGNPRGHGSMLQGSRTFNASPYAVTFTLEIMAVSPGHCANVWLTMLHSSDVHNDAFRMFCDHFNFHAHNNANNNSDSASPNIPLTLGIGVSHSMRAVVVGQTLTLYCLDDGTPTIMGQFVDPQPNVVSGASVVFYDDVGTDALITNITGEPWAGQ